MIPLDRVRELLAALRPRALESLAREEPDWNDLCSYLGCAELFVAAPDLARQVLSLADALTTAERERDALRANRGTVDRILSAWAAIAHAHRVDPSPANAERLATLATCAAQVRDEALAERDTARSALDGLTAAVREVEESEGALETMIDDSAWTLDDERIAEERVAAAHTALDALLSAAPPRSTVPATVVRAYLRADARSATGTHADATALAAARTALDAALAGCA